MNHYTVFVSTDSGATWMLFDELQGKGDEDAKSLLAASPDRAIEKLREDAPKFKTNTDAQFFAIKDFKPKKMIRRLVETFDLGFVDDDPDDGAAGEPQGKLTE